MKKLFCLILVLTMLLASCGKPAKVESSEAVVSTSESSHVSDNSDISSKIDEPAAGILDLTEVKNIKNIAFKYSKAWEPVTEDGDYLSYFLDSSKYFQIEAVDYYSEYKDVTECKDILIDSWNIDDSFKLIRESIGTFGEIPSLTFTVSLTSNDITTYITETLFIFDGVTYGFSISDLVDTEEIRSILDTIVSNVEITSGSGVDMHISLVEEFDIIQEDQNLNYHVVIFKNDGDVTADVAVIFDAYKGTTYIGQASDTILCVKPGDEGIVVLVNPADEYFTIESSGAGRKSTNTPVSLSYTASKTADGLDITIKNESGVEAQKVCVDVIFYKNGEAVDYTSNGLGGSYYSIPSGGTEVYSAATDYEFDDYKVILAGYGK